MKPPHLRPIRNVFITIAKSLTWCGAILLALATAAPTMTQLAIPSIPGFSNNYPWFNEVPQYQGDQSFQWFLANHPNISGNTGAQSRPAVRRQLACTGSGVATVPGEPSL